MAKKKYYAVQKGRVPGVYDEWSKAQEQISGFAGAVYKSFSDKEEAAAFLEKDGYEKRVPNEPVIPDSAYVFVDGSYNPDSKVYGYGGFLVLPEVNGIRREVVIQGSGSDPGMASMRNVAGEIEGCLTALRTAKQYDQHDVTVFYDYAGIEKWAAADASERWTANRPGTQQYQKSVDALRQSGMTIRFQHVYAHTGIQGNERVDRLAKEAVGIGVSKHMEEDLFEK